MGFDYNNSKNQGNKTHEWSAYADLFMVLSMVFLLLYVMAGLREGSFSVQQHTEYQRVTHEVNDLRQQLKVYNTLKEDYLDKKSTKAEQDSYKDLMSQLDLLQEKAKEDKNDLRQRARENEKKEKALNHYQQLIRNVINSNILAKTKLERRDSIIKEQTVELSQKFEEIQGLQDTLVEKKKSIEAGERRISQVNKRLDKKLKQLKRSYKSNKISKSKMKARIQVLKQKSRDKIKSVTKNNQNLQKELKDVNSSLYVANNQLEQSESDRANAVDRLSAVEASMESQRANLQDAHDSKMAAEQDRFDRKIKAQKLSQAKRQKEIQKFKQKIAKKENNLKNKLAKLNQKMNTTKSDLRKARSKLNARKKIANAIKRNFALAGFQADVDPQTGDVVLAFGREYFRTGSYKMKKGMESVLQQLVPVYTKSIFSDKKTAKKISSIEIIGFASPTFNGKLVDPHSLNSKDKKAVSYNLDLSYFRAKAIFKHIFDTKKMKYKHQKDLLPLVKVVGRSFLAEEVKGRGIASGIGRKEYCKKYDCKKSQRVIIKFSLKD